MKELKGNLRKILGKRSAKQIRGIMRTIRNCPVCKLITERVNPIKVSFIVAGAQKGGTRALYYFLSQHPKISLSTINETNFFSHEKNWENGADYSKYKKYFKGSLRKKIYGEVSPMYMFRHEVTAPRISEYNPDMKLIFILRNPIDRAYSQYKMHVKKHNLKLTFEECLDIAKRQPKEKVILDPESGFSTNKIKRYIEFGNYSEQIRSFQKCFPSDQILILLNEDLKNDHDETMRRIFDFLGVRPISTKKKMVHSNPGKQSSTESMEMLRREYLQEIEDLESLLQRNLDHWKQSASTTLK